MLREDWWDEQYTETVDDVLDKKGTIVEPDVRAKLKGYFKAMGLSGSTKKKMKVSELRTLVRDLLEADTIIGRTHLNSEEDEEDECTMREFTDYSVDFPEEPDQKRYELMANQLHQAWTERGPDVPWDKVVSRYAANKEKSNGMIIDRNKLLEKVLELVEKDYIGDERREKK